MLSKSKIKLITSLSQKKQRDELGIFIAEGSKLVADMLPAFSCKLIVATASWLQNHPQAKADEIIETDEDNLRKVSNHKSPQGVLAIFEKPCYQIDPLEINNALCLALDDIQDPGNLGTILRIADWFGIYNLFCSEHTADAFSPKTVQATMGALVRIKVHVVNLPKFLTAYNTKVPIYGTFMDGDDIYNKTLTNNGIIVMGNEGNGISSDIEKLVSDKLLIPNFPAGHATSESLNVGIATALVCGEFRRRCRE